MQEAHQARQVPLWMQEAHQARQRRKPVRCWFSGKKVPLWMQEGARLGSRRCCLVSKKVQSKNRGQNFEPRALTFPFLLSPLTPRRSAFGGLRRAHFDPARQCPGGHLEQVGDDLGDVFGLNLPGVRLGRCVTTEVRGDTARHDVRNFDAELAQVQHDRLRKSVQAELAGVVGRTVLERVLSGQARDGDDVPLGFLEGGHGGFDAVEGSGQVGVDHGMPVFD